MKILPKILLMCTLAIFFTEGSSQASCSSNCVEYGADYEQKCINEDFYNWDHKVQCTRTAIFLIDVCRGFCKGIGANNEESEGSPYLDNGENLIDDDELEDEFDDEFNEIMANSFE